MHFEKNLSQQEALAKRFCDTPYQLHDIQLFQHVSEPDLEFIRKIVGQCGVLKVKANQVVITARSTGANLYIVLAGALGITTASQEGRPSEQVGTQYQAGECVGELSVLDEESHSATIAALVDSEILAIDSVSVWKLIEETNGVAKNLLRLLSFRIRTANAQIRNRQKVGEFYRQLSMIDGLTGLHNRAWLNSQLPALIDNARLSATALSIIMVDLDHFKRFNDEFGHVAGDDALQTAAKVLNAGLRPSDFAARYGGEEMIVLLPNTNLPSAQIVAERLCEKLRNTPILTHADKELPHITASFGLACLADEQDANQVIACADAALYRAKEAGRNRVSL